MPVLEPPALRHETPFRILVQDLAAHVPHQPAMPAHQTGKSRFITRADKLFE